MSERYLLVVTFADSELEEVGAAGRIILMIPGVTQLHLVQGVDVALIDALRTSPAEEP